MTLEDADFMLALKNDPITRQFAIVSHEEIKREDHIRFLKVHLPEFKVIEKYDFTKVGVIRVSLEHEVSIWLAPEFREYGIASRVLRNEIGRPLIYPGVHWCKIVNGNIASFRAFIKAGFKPSEYKDNYYILTR